MLGKVSRREERKDEEKAGKEGMGTNVNWVKCGIDLIEREWRYMW